jgi:hypothetical protein
MARVRVSTTVDGELLADARRLAGRGTDADLLDDALSALLARNRAAEIDDSYHAYEVQPLGQHDEWGDLASFLEAAVSSRRQSTRAS